MMKKVLSLAICIAMVFTLVTVVFSANELSPSLSLLRKKTTLTKTVVGAGEIRFSLSDFENVLGIKDLTSITVTSLPPVEDGVLKLGNVDVMKDQTIPRGSIGYLKLVPNENAKKITFSFKAGNGWDADTTCVVNILDTINFAPISESSQKITTIKGVSVVANLNGTDPDGDKVTFNIVKYPKKGSLTLKDAEKGEIVYSPNPSFMGNDSFTYVVVDEYGNTSKEIKASVKVDANKAGIVYSDMKDNPAHVDALMLAADGIVCHENIAGVYYFNPTAKITKSDFLVMLMMAADQDSSAKKDIVTFADENTIPASHIGYIERAYELSLFEGEQKADGIYAMLNEPITRAEAAVMISRLLSLEGKGVTSVFADASSIPDWAQNSVVAVFEAGIMTNLGENTICPNDALDRAQSASILMNVKEYLTKKPTESFWEKLFG